MKKVFYVAVREFVATVATKAFVLGVLVTPAMLAIVFFVFSKMDFDKPPKIDGEVAIVDPTGILVEDVRAYLAPEAIAERRGELREKKKKAGGASAELKKLEAAHAKACLLYTSPSPRDA